MREIEWMRRHVRRNPKMIIGVIVVIGSVTLALVAIDSLRACRVLVCNKSPARLQDVKVLLMDSGHKKLTFSLDLEAGGCGSYSRSTSDLYVLDVTHKGRSLVRDGERGKLGLITTAEVGIIHISELGTVQFSNGGPNLIMRVLTGGGWSR